MKRFNYQARDLNGKPYKGIVEAREVKQAAKILRDRSLYPFAVAEEGGGPLDIAAKLNKRISFKDVVVFTRQLSTMITAGLQLTEALSLLRSQVSPVFAEVVSDILNAVEGGMTFSEALSRHPAVFSRVYIALVKTGEAAGILDTVLSRMADNMENEEEFRATVKGAMIYPVILLIGMTVVIFLMMTLVVPKLLALFKDFNASMPLPTLIMIKISDFFVQFWWLILLVVFGGYYLFTLYRATPNGRRKIDELYLKIPIIGPLSRMIVLTEFSRTLSLLVGAGIPIIESLKISAEAIDNTLYSDAILSSAKSIEKGFPLAYALAETERFPPIVTQMVSVGEETGKVGDVLFKVSRYFETESAALVKGLTTAIEPIIIVILGVGVGFLMVAVIFPIYSLISQIGNM
jgi:type IV pilus assembly protein PilC